MVVAAFRVRAAFSYLCPDGPRALINSRQSRISD
jgi:hypothetical protein